MSLLSYLHIKFSMKHIVRACLFLMTWLNIACVSTNHVELKANNLNKPITQQVANKHLNGFQELIERTVIGDLKYAQYHYKLVRMKLPAGKAGAGSVTDYPRYFFGVDSKNGKELIAPRFDLILPMGKKGLVLSKFSDKGIQAVSLVPWNGFPPVGKPLVQPLSHVSTSAKRDWVKILKPRYDRSVPYAEALVHWNKNSQRITRYDKTGQVTHVWHSAVLGERNVGDRSTIKQEKGLVVLGELWQPLSIHAKTRILNMKKKSGSQEYLISESPKDPNLYWLAFKNGFAAPPQSDGVVPLEQWWAYSSGGRVVSSVYIPKQSFQHSYTNWLIAYPTSNGHIWGFANTEFTIVEKPSFLEYKIMPSYELAREPNYPVNLNPEWTLLRKISNGRWIITRHANPRYTEIREDFPTAIAAYEAAERKIKKETDIILRAIKRENVRSRKSWAAARDLAKRRYASAFKAGDRNGMRKYANQAGGETLHAYIYSGYAPTHEIRQALKSDLSPFTKQERIQLSRDANIIDNEMARQQKLRAREQEAAKKAAYWASRAESHKANWAAWRSQQQKASKINQKAVSKQFYRDAMKAYRDGHTNVLPSLPR